MKRSRVRPKRRAPRRREAPRWTSEQWATAEFMLQQRAGFACERCGRECGPVHRHHRKRRREGGDSIENLVLLGSPCHAEVHAHPAIARREGFIVSVSRNPAEVPLHWRRREWVVLGPDGEKRDVLVPSEDAQA